MRVVISDAAEADLGATGDYIARDNPRRAVSFMDHVAIAHILHGASDDARVFEA